MFARLLPAARALAAIAMLASGIASAQTVATPWPTKPVRIIVPAPAGSSPDVLARMFANEYQAALGQSFYVENKPGASGILGADAVAKAAPDGTTVLFGFAPIAAINPFLFKSLPYNAERDLTPVSITNTGVYVLIANNDLPANNMAELIALARREPGKLNYASIGPGSVLHLGMLMLEGKTGIRMTHVPYRQSYVPDLLAGIVQLVMEPAGSAMPLVKTGKVKALGIGGSKRLEALPNVATIGETVPGMHLTGWNAFWFPAKTPEGIVRKFEAEAVRVARLPHIGSRMRELGFEPAGTSGADMQQAIRVETRIWGDLIKANNLSLD